METLRVDGLPASCESDSENLLIFLSLTPGLPLQYERQDYKNEQKVICAQNISFQREKDRTLLHSTLSHFLIHFVLLCFHCKIKTKSTVTHFIFLTTDYRTVRFYCLLMFKGSIRCNIFKVLGLYPLYCPSIKDEHQ